MGAVYANWNGDFSISSMVNLYNFEIKSEVTGASEDSMLNYEKLQSGDYQVFSIPVPEELTHQITFTNTGTLPGIISKIEIVPKGDLSIISDMGIRGILSQDSQELFRFEPVSGLESSLTQSKSYLSAEKVNEVLYPGQKKIRIEPKGLKDVLDLNAQVSNDYYKFEETCQITLKSISNVQKYLEKMRIIDMQIISLEAQKDNLLSCISDLDSRKSGLESDLTNLAEEDSKVEDSIVAEDGGGDQDLDNTTTVVAGGGVKSDEATLKAAQAASNKKAALARQARAKRLSTINAKRAEIRSRQAAVKTEQAKINSEIAAKKQAVNQVLEQIGSAQKEMQEQKRLLALLREASFEVKVYFEKFKTEQ